MSMNTKALELTDSLRPLVQHISSQDARIAELERALAAAERERDEAYDRAAKVADEFDFGLGSQSQLVSAIRALAKEREA